MTREMLSLSFLTSSVESAEALAPWRRVIGRRWGSCLTRARAMPFALYSTIDITMLAKYRQDQLHQACSTNAYLGLKNDETFRGQKVRVTNSLVQGKMYRGFRNEISLSPKMRDWRIRQPMKISKDITRTKNRRQPSLLPFVAVSANSWSAAFRIWLIRTLEVRRRHTHSFLQSRYALSVSYQRHSGT